MQDPVHLARELARIAKQNDLAEIEYRSEPLRLRLIFEEKPVLQAAPVFQHQPGFIPAPAELASPVEEAPALQAPAHPVICSPLAGIFYQAPRPGSPPFVEVNEGVQTGHTLCIVEAMKQMNEITAERPLKIVKVLVENASVVESGQPLFEYEPVG